MAGHSTARVQRGEASHDPRASVLRALAMDAVQAANSGHPGAPMGMAEMAVALWERGTTRWDDSRSSPVIFAASHFAFFRNV